MKLAEIFTYYRELWLFMRLEKHLLLPLKKGFLASSRRSRITRQRRSSERVKYFCSLGGTLLVCSIFQGGLERLDCQLLLRRPRKAYFRNLVNSCQTVQPDPHGCGAIHSTHGITISDDCTCILGTQSKVLSQATQPRVSLF